MAHRILNFIGFIGESTIHKSNYWEINHPDKWQALQELGFRDVTTDRMKKMGNNVILQNDEIPLYPSGIVYQESGYIREKPASSGFIATRKNWIEAADYLIKKFQKIKDECPRGISLQFFVFILRHSTIKITKNFGKKIVANPQNRTVSIHGNFTLKPELIEKFLSFGYSLDYVKNYSYSDYTAMHYFPHKILSLSRELCGQIFPKKCDQFDVSAMFSEDCKDITIFPPVKERIRIETGGSIDNFKCLSPAQPDQIVGFSFSGNLNSLEDLYITKCNRVSLECKSPNSYNFSIDFPNNLPTRTNKIITGKWGFENWFKVIREGTPEQVKLMLTLPQINLDYWNSEISTNPVGALLRLAAVWDKLPEDIQRGIKIPSDRQGDFDNFLDLERAGVF